MPIFDQREDDYHYERGDEYHNFRCATCNKQFDEEELKEYDGDYICDDCLEEVKNEECDIDEELENVCLRCGTECEDYELEEFKDEKVCNDCFKGLKEEHTKEIRSLFEDMIDDNITLISDGSTKQDIEDSFDEYISKIKKELFQEITCN